MHTVTKKIIEHGSANRFIRVDLLQYLLGGTAKRRYGLVNRALKSGELLRVQRGLYVLSSRFRKHPPHPFALAQALSPGSYVSFETALSYHGWIPEKAVTVSSVCPGRKSKRYEHVELGVCSFHPLAVQKGFFLELVQRLNVDGQTMLLADPCRALMDLVCLRKIAWHGIDWLVEGMRIDVDSLSGITTDDFNTLRHIYKQNRVQEFIDQMFLEVGVD